MRPVVVLAVLALGAACERGAPVVPSPTDAAVLAKRIEDLETQIQALEHQASTLSAEVTRLSVRQMGHAVFSPDTTTYMPVTTDAGRFLVALKKVSPYADGQRLTFLIGNPQSLLFRNPTVKVTWGKRQGMAPEEQELTEEEEMALLGITAANQEDARDSKQHVASSAPRPLTQKEGIGGWEPALHSKEERVHATLHPGVWTEVSILVGPAAPEDVGHIEFSMAVSTVSVTTR